MRTRGRLVRTILAVLASSSFAAGSRAQLLVVGALGEESTLSHAELAYATGPGTPATWLSLRIGRGPVAVIAALPEGATSEPAFDAWFDALEATASPNVLLPRGQTDCGKPSSFSRVVWPRSPGAAPSELRLDRAADVLAALMQQGLAPPDAPLPDAPHYLLWSWAEADAERTTRTLRVRGQALPLYLGSGGTVPVLLSVVSRGPVGFADEVAAPLRVTFAAGKTTTDYRARVQDWLEGRREPLLESRGQGLLFDWSIHEDTVSLPPLVRNYAVAAAGESSQIEADACSEQLGGLRDAGAPSVTACADALDASLALLATGAEQPTLQRFVLSGAAAIASSSLGAGGQVSAPVLRAELVDTSACPDFGPAPPIIWPPNPNGGARQEPRRPTTTVVVEETVVVEQSPPGDAACGSSPGRDPYHDRESVGCYADSSSGTGDDSCSGDSSSGNDGDGSCSGDSSSGNDGDGSCSGDSSSGSDSDTCSGDSSSGRDRDDSCSGSSDSGYDGDTCTGSAAPRGEPARAARAAPHARLHRTRPQRLKLSLWTLAFAAVLLPIRRRKRPSLR